MALFARHAAERSEPDAGRLEAARSATAPAARVCRRIASEVSYYEINSRCMAFETSVSKQPRKSGPALPLPRHGPDESRTMTRAERVLSSQPYRVGRGGVCV